MLDKDKEIMNSIYWWHRIEIDGEVTPGSNMESEDAIKAIGLPKNLSGKSVIDIGCWDGFYSYECEKRGANRVVAVDKFIWSDPTVTDAGFNFAHRCLNSNVEKVVSFVEDIPKLNLGKFDIVLMLGVIYHAKNPIQYIEIARDLSKDMVVFETAVDLLDVNVPAVRYYIGDELNNDPTNYWGFNELAMHGMMKDAGFKKIDTIKLPNPGRMIFIGKV